MESLKVSLRQEEPLLSVSEVMSAAGFEAGQRLAEEQDYVQAYENVREKYKGKPNAGGSPHACCPHTHTQNQVTAASRLCDRFAVTM